MQERAGMAPRIASPAKRRPQVRTSLSQGCAVFQVIIK
jgi:hypothetical protein